MLALGQWSHVVQQEAPTAERKEASHRASGKMGDTKSEQGEGTKNPTA